MGIKIEPGTRFNKLVVLNQEPSVGTGCRYLCRCDCGSKTVVRAGSLRAGQKSCGCLVGKNKTHGMTGSRLFNIYYSMKSRCNNENSKDYKNYGGRGIVNMFTCFEDFCQWALASGYNPTLTVERVDNDGPYSRDNCRWATVSEQQVNTRRTKLILDPFTGEKVCMAVLARRHGLSRGVLWYRLRVGGDVRDILTKKPAPMKKPVQYITNEETGEKKTPREWGDLLGRKWIVFSRLRAGWPTQRAITKPIRGLGCDT